MSTSRHGGNGIIAPNRTNDGFDMLELPGLLEINISRNDVPDPDKPIVRVLTFDKW